MRKAPFKLGKLKYNHITQILQLSLVLLVISSTVLYTINGFDGFKIALNAGVATLAAAVTEVLFARSWGRLKSLKRLYFQENILIIPLTVTLLLPLHAPMYVVAVATIVGTWIGKLVYGGYGYNIFNASVVGVLFAQVSFKSQLVLPEGLIYPLQMVKDAAFVQNIALLHQQPLFLGTSDYYFYSVGAVSGLLLVVVMLVLGFLKVIDLRASITFLATVFGMSWIIGGNYFAMENLLTGMVLFAAVYLVTDPVTTPTSRETKMIFASFVGLVTVMIRVLGTNLEGVLFAVLLGNLITPYINRTARRSGIVAFIKALIFVLVVIIGGGLIIGMINQPEVVAELVLLEVLI